MSDTPPDTSAIADETPTDDTVAIRRQKRRRAGVEWAIIAVVAVVASLLLRTYAFQTFYIPSGSMEPTLQVGDRIVVDKLAVDWGTINRGDVLVFHAPPSENCGATVTDLVKRVVGIPGDTITSRGNAIIVNGHVLQEKWTHTEPLGTPIDKQVVPANSYFMVGDNHNNSCDSRMWGTVPRADVVGKAFLRIWPLGRFGML